jgi:hypothetical protein
MPVYGQIAGLPALDRQLAAGDQIIRQGPRLPPRPADAETGVAPQPMADAGGPRSFSSAIRRRWDVGVTTPGDIGLLVDWSFFGFFCSLPRCWPLGMLISYDRLSCRADCCPTC